MRKSTKGSLEDDGNILQWGTSAHVLDSPSKLLLHPKNDSKLTIIVDSVLNKTIFKRIETGEPLHCFASLFFFLKSNIFYCYKFN